MVRITGLLVLVSTLLLGSPELRAQERGHALVIGNGDYRDLGRLATPVSDARLVADTLRRSGFRVLEQSNLDERALRRTLRQFVEQMDSAGPNSAAIVYLAGFGLFSEGANFFLPVSAQLRRPEDVGAQGLSLDDITGALAAASPRLRVLLVDLARPIPNLDRQQFGGGGLGGVLLPEQTIVGLSTQPGTLMAEGDRNSPYAAALGRYLAMPGLQIEESLRQVRCEVYHATNGQQIPWSSSTYIGTFVIAPGQAQTADTCEPPRAAQPGTDRSRAGARVGAAPGFIPVPREKPRGQTRITRERIRELPPEEAYETVIDDGSVEAYETFVEIYPNDPRARVFRERVRSRRENDVWLEVVEQNTPEAYTRYIQTYPYGAYRRQAVTRIERYGARVPDLPPPPREYLEQIDRPRATIVGPGTVAPRSREEFVPGAQLDPAQRDRARERQAPAGQPAATPPQPAPAPPPPQPAQPGAVTAPVTPAPPRPSAAPPPQPATPAPQPPAQPAPDRRPDARPAAPAPAPAPPAPGPATPPAASAPAPRSASPSGDTPQPRVQPSPQRTAPTTEQPAPQPGRTAPDPGRTDPAPRPEPNAAPSGAPRPEGRREREGAPGAGSPDQRPERPDRGPRPDRPDRPDRPNAGERPQRPDRPGRPEGGERPGRPGAEPDEEARPRRVPQP